MSFNVDHSHTFPKEETPWNKGNLCSRSNSFLSLPPAWTLSTPSFAVFCPFLLVIVRVLTITFFLQYYFDLLPIIHCKHRIWWSLLPLLVAPPILLLFVIFSLTICLVLCCLTQTCYESVCFRQTWARKQQSRPQMPETTVAHSL